MTVEKNFMQMVLDHAAENGCKREEALLSLMKKYPNAWRAYLMEKNSNRDESGSVQQGAKKLVIFQGIIR